MKPNSKLAFRSLETIAACQEQLLRAHVAFCKEHSPYYRSVLENCDPSAVTLQSLEKFPLTDKADLASRQPEFVAVPRSQIVDIVFSSGTSGQPVQMMYTAKDLDRLAYNEMLAFAACGITPEDTVLLTCTLDRCFIAGLAYFSGGCRRGAAMIRNGQGTLESHEAVIFRTSPTVLVGIPSFLRKLGLYLVQRGVDVAALSVEKLICIGEPVRVASMELSRLGSDLETLWGAKVFSTYASSETITTFCECSAQQGGHLHPDLGIVEIVDPAGHPLPPGIAGEVVVTPLQMEGMPLLRFKTGDIAFLLAESCGCGRNTPRLGPIIGRKNQMMKVQGTTLYPPAVFAALDELSGVCEYCLTVQTCHELSDQLTLHLALTPDAPNLDAIKRFLQARLRVTPSIVLEGEEALRRTVFPPGARKPVRFIDQRG
jgi:phenylacetate-CoA ligase